MRRSSCGTAFIVLLGLSLLLSTSNAIPVGFTTFFSSATCPNGWYQLGTASGRLIVSVANSTVAGITVNTPLSDQEDRVHLHAYTTSVTLNSKNIAADDCCNGLGACSGTYVLNAATLSAPSGYPFVQLILCTINQTTSDAVPFGTIAYFEPSVTACPANWKPLSISTGRIMIPGYSDTGITLSAAQPLQSGEDRVHSHSFNASVSIADLSYAGVDGCCNNALTSSGTSVITGVTNNATTGLPYIQLLTCVNQQQTFSSSFPSSTLLFNEVSCPPGWNVTLPFAGRFPVALPTKGVPGATFGGASFEPGFTGDATHHHPFKGTLSTRSCEVGLIDGCCADGYGANGNYLYQNLSGDSQAQIPYMSVPLCVQVSGGGGGATAAATATATATAPRKPAVGEGSARIIRRKKH